MSNKITNYQLLITDKVRITALATAMLMLAASGLYAGEAQALTFTAASPVNITPVVKYNFKLYILAKGTMKKNIPLPDFGWRILKAYPLRVREFTLPAPYMDAGAREFKIAAGGILNGVDEPHRKNAVRVAEAVFAYIGASITAGADAEGITENPHKAFSCALQVIKAGSGNVLEKCRLAAAMLRYFLIPARIVSSESQYALEYYIQPLAEAGKGAWYLHSFIDAGQAEDEFLVPADWHPVDAKELLFEEWTGPMYLKEKRHAREFLSADDAGSQAAFAALTGTAKNIESSAGPKSGVFYFIDEHEYELWLNNGTTESKAEFTLPFNIQDDLKTIKYAVVSDDKNLTVKAKWPQTKNKPLQDGVIYTLPVSFRVDKH